MSNIAFPGTAETRAAYLSELTGHIESRATHLRELSHHMHALELTKASLADVETEAVELELAVSVYRRFGGGPGDQAPRSDEPTANGADGSAPKEGDSRASDPAPTFSQFALTHLGSPEAEDTDGDQAAEAASQDDNGNRPSWLASRSSKGV